CQARSALRADRARATAIARRYQIAKLACSLSAAMPGRETSGRPGLSHRERCDTERPAVTPEHEDEEPPHELLPTLEDCLEGHIRRPRDERAPVGAVAPGLLRLEELCADEAEHGDAAEEEESGDVAADDHVRERPEARPPKKRIPCHTENASNDSRVGEQLLRADGRRLRCGQPNARQKKRDEAHRNHGKLEPLRSDPENRKRRLPVRSHKPKEGGEGDERIKPKIPALA